MLPAFIFFIILLTALLWVIIYSKGLFSHKVIFITLSLYLSFSILLSVENFRGWPSSQPLPENFEVEWLIVEEPDKDGNFSGAIYVWLRSVEIEPECEPIILCLHDISEEPRVYEIPYTKMGHKEALNMLEKIKHGDRVAGQSPNKKNGLEYTFENLKFYDFNYPGLMQK